MEEFVPFLKSAEIQSAEVSGNRIKVTIVASSERRDKDGDMFLKSAWEEPEDKDWYLQKGYYDYNHLTRILRMDKGTPEQIAKAELARAQAIIGYPKTLECGASPVYENQDVLLRSARQLPDTQNSLAE